MQQALRPHAIAGLALAVGAGLIVLNPVTAPSPAVPHVYLSDVQLAAGPTIVLPDPLSGIENVLTSDFSTLESDVTHGFSTLESDLTSDLSGLGTLSGLDSNLVSGFSTLESDLTSGFTTLTEALIGYPNDLPGTNSIEDWLERLHTDLDGSATDSSFVTTLQNIDTLLSNGVGQLVNIDYILFIECGVACADFAP
jgi:hypothetical protein